MSASLSGKAPSRNVRIKNRTIRHPSASPRSSTTLVPRTLLRAAGRDGVSFGFLAASGGLSVVIGTLRQSCSR